MFTSHFAKHSDEMLGLEEFPVFQRQWLRNEDNHTSLSNLTGCFEMF